MDDDTILSVRTVGRAGPHAVVAPSPTLELVYACFYLSRVDSGDLLPWARELRRDAPEVAAAAAGLAGGKGAEGPARLLFAITLDGGYAGDPDPVRFLRELPDAFARFREASLAGEGAGALAEHETAARWLLDPEDPDWPATAADALAALWERLARHWREVAGPAAEEAAQGVREGLERHGDVVRALPSHHFAQFESLAAKLRESMTRGRLRIVPLALAEGGGFHLEGDAEDALGFGLRTDTTHARRESRVRSAADGAKVLGDPTRLMLLSMITGLSTLTMTVGDLARQLGVSQPTVSGHLRTLRDAGLIRMERRGNRSFPSADPEGVRRVLDELEQVLEL